MVSILVRRSTFAITFVRRAVKLIAAAVHCAPRALFRGCFRCVCALFLMSHFVRAERRRASAALFYILLVCEDRQPDSMKVYRRCGEPPVTVSASLTLCCTAVCCKVGLAGRQKKGTSTTAVQYTNLTRAIVRRPGNGAHHDCTLRL